MNVLESSEEYSVPAMAYILQSRTSTVGERIAALRSLKQHLEEDKSIDAYSKKRIKQLILDNVLHLILSEEKVTNIVKRQLVRTELFLILAKLLDSNALFGSVLNHDANSVSSSHAESVHEYDSGIDSINSRFRPPPPKTPGGSSRIRPGLDRRINNPPGGWVHQSSQVSQLTQFSSSQGHASPQHHGHHRQGNISPLRHSSSTGKLEVGFPDSPYGSKDQLSTSVFSRGESRGRSRTSGRVGPDVSLLKPLLQKQARSNQKVSFTSTKAFSSKMWKPRPSVLHDELVADSFVPGADPSNYFEQDRKLGYQKPRMWFPGSISTSVQSEMIPHVRSDPKVAAANARRLASEQVVQEFLQMRSLASYVGDLVAPYSPVSAKESYMTIKPGSPNRPPSSPGGKSSTNSRMTGLTDQARFHTALREIAHLWSPLLGVHLPPPRSGLSTAGSRKRKMPFAGNNHSNSANSSHYGSNHNNNGSSSSNGGGSGGAYSEYAQEIVPFKCLRVDASHGNKAQTRRHTVQEYEQQKQETLLLSKTMRPIDEPGDGSNSTEYGHKTKQYQHDVSAYLQLQKEHVMASVRASERLIQATLQSQYHLFKPKYLLLQEGNKANSRAVLASAMVIFSRVKMNNLLALAFGTWKILLVQMASLARRPLYARVASCYLMSRWQQEVHLKKLRIWIVRWRRRAGALIFIQRSMSVVRIQTMYRTWRDRRKFIAMHLSKTFQGVLSDIFLDRKRPELIFFIPDIIRNDRRLLWKAATFIQTLFRCYIASKMYFYKRRMILLIQSIIRMFPRYKKYKKLRATTIKCQAWARRTVKQIQYKRLKRATIIVQKYVRRYLCTIHKLATFERMWRAGEQPLAAVIKIQCRYRIRLARKKVRAKKFAIAMRKYSALVIQRNYYRYKKAFHTFFLMCCLRERESEDIKSIKRKTARGRYRAACKIQKFYKNRYFKRNISAVVRVQCWFRGRMGYGLVDILRKERWASRKLRAWAKVKVNRRRKMARRIQKWWWGCKEGRLRKHLWHRFRLLDAEDDLRRSELRHFAAMRIQAYVKGVWDRIFVRRLRAVLIIQRNAKFFFAMKRWRRWKKERIMKIVRKYTAYVQEKAVKNVLARILRRHSDNMKRPQALGRGFIVRTIMKHARWVAHRMGMAVVKIQRCWRRQKVRSKAIEEVMARKRALSNPFAPLNSPHEVLLMMRRQTKTLYSCYDPRVGLRVSSFLYRLGCIDMVDMFPRKNYVTVSDMSNISMFRLNELYEVWKSRPVDASKQKSQGSVKVKKKAAAPTQLFETILGIVKPPLYSTIKMHRDKIKTIQSLPEYEVPQHAAEGFKKTFQKKFGKNLNTRAEHMAHDLIHMIWGDFNNFKTVGLIYTKHQVLKAINAASDSNHPLQELPMIRSRETGIVDERKWDKERISKTAGILQLAVDRILPLLPPGKLKMLVERANNRVIAYRRKMQFVRQRMVTSAQPAPRADRRSSVASNHSGKGEEHDHLTTPSKGSKAISQSVNTTPTSTAGSVEAVTPSGDGTEVRGALDLTSAGVLNTVLPISRSLELPLNSASVADLDLECEISVCRVFCDVLDKMYMMTRAVQSLKNSWHNSTLRRALATEKALRFKAAVKQTYLSDRGTDKVKLVWLKHKRIETSKKKLDIIMKAVHARKAAAKFALSFVPRHGWITLEDYNGYPYWFDTKPRHAEEATYDMPTYSLPQYFMILKVQHAARGFIERLHERKLLREAEARAEVARLEKLMEEERKKGARQVKTKFSIVSRLLNGPDSAGHKKKHSLHAVSPVPSLDSLLPWKYQFEENPIFRSGYWALMRHNSAAHHEHDEEPAQAEPLWKQYDIVVIFRLKEGDSACDVRNVKGKTTRNVSLKRLSQMRLDVGMNVETRYKQEKVFYRSVISHIDTLSHQEPMYSIKYEDGETATQLRRDAIRPSPASLRAFLRGREQLLRTAKQQHRRLEHFYKLKKERLGSYEARVLGLQQAQEENSPHLLMNGSPSPPESPLLMLENPDPVLMLENNASKSGEDFMSLAMVVVPSGDEADMTTPSKKTSTALIHRSNSTKDVHSHAVTVALSMVRVDIKVRLPYARVVNRFGWRTYQEVPASGRPYDYYVNEFTEEVADEQPAYTATEVQYATRIQAAWLAYTAKCKMWRRVLSINIIELIQSTVKKGAKVAYVGFELEGVTPMQMLRRAGYWELSEIFESYYKGMKWNLHNLSLEEIAKKPKDNYENFGVIQPQHQKELKDFQAWWHKTTLLDKQKRLTLFNYFKSPEDPRSIQQCIADSEEMYVAKFMKYNKTGSARTRQAVQSILETSLFPHAHQQVETYLKKYEGKAELTREMVFELMNKHTTHTWVEERVVLRYYKNCVRVLGAMLGILKLRSLRSVVTKAEKQVEAIMRSAPHGHGRPLCTGPEAKAALVLRKQVFQYLTKYITAVEIVQRNVRAYLLSKQWNIYLIARMRSIGVIQRCARRTLAYRLARALTLQKSSEWEQLWDSRRNYLYYYNYATGASQYNEPDEPFRPLVRDPLSAMLIQAWPELDNRNGVVALLPITQGSTAVAVPMQASHTHCGICKTRKCVRICLDCTDEVDWDTSKYHCFPYCFTCYMKEHVDDNAERAAHHYTIVEDEPTTATDAFGAAEQLYLRCSMCEEPATRKCMGLLDDEAIDRICSELRRTAPEEWVAVLKEANVAGDRKLTLLLDQIRSESVAVINSVVAFQSTADSTALVAAAPKKSASPGKLRGKLEKEPEKSPELPSPTTKTLSVAHLQAIRGLLENSRAECDECYCATCYQEVHAGGKRALHKWKGFQVRASVCTVCTNCPAELNCLDCESKYCASCYKVFHGMGRKRNHKREKVLEVLQEDQVYCGLCDRRPANTPCENDKCHFSGCDSCMWFRHLPQCNREVTVMGGSPSSRSKKAPSDERPGSPEVSAIVLSNAADNDSDACVVCGELADQRCVQCRDCYCSRTWMGNAGCFAQHHSKGNRTAHTTELYISNRELMMSMRKSKSMRNSRKNLVALSPGK